MMLSPYHLHSNVDAPPNGSVTMPRDNSGMNQPEAYSYIT